jgi:prepilin-type N-terminal cleavage/methylation domain-containing protein
MAVCHTLFERFRGTSRRPGSFANHAQASCQSRIGFTLIELLVVIAILGILGSALVVSVQSGYKQARQANCKSNLRQFGVALTIYRGEHDNRTPDWLSNLYPEYVDDRAMYVCRADSNGGRDRVRPEDFVAAIRDSSALDANKFRDNESNSDNTRNRAVECCSYFYEFSIASPGWGKDRFWPEGDYSTLNAYKNAQLTYGDENSGKDSAGNPLPYSASRIPIIRCYHHWRDMRLYGVAYVDRSSRRATKQYITLNVAYAGNVFVGPPWWEGTIHPGESRD